jgi:mannose-1-phosphate guanylyltransferase
MIDENETMIVLPADHYIRNTDKFIQVLRKGVEITENDHDALVTIGIQPTYPETGYGYIQVGDLVNEDIYKVSCFAEKPNLHTAMRFLDSGDFYWNSGIFIWKAKTILAKIKEFLPEMYEGLMQIKASMTEGFSQAVLERVYKEFKSISIDYGVMEKADNVKVVIGDFGWSDVGSWQEIYRLKDKNAYNNVADVNLVAIDTEGCYFSSVNKDKVFATIGLKNIAVVDTDDAILIAPLDRSQEVKEIVEKLKNQKINNVL